MPFSLCNAVPAFERLMDTVHVDLKRRVCLVYLDDCVIFIKDFPSHLVRLRQVPPSRLQVKHEEMSLVKKPSSLLRARRDAFGHSAQPREGQGHLEGAEAPRCA